MKRIDFEYYWTDQKPVDGRIYGVTEILADADLGGIDFVVLIAGPIEQPNNRGLAEICEGSAASHWLLPDQSKIWSSCSG